MLSEDERIARLQEEARKRGFPLIRPVDAATLVILDRSGPQPKVLMGKRHAGHKFMPGLFVFPGGRSEKGDAAIPLAGDLDAMTLRHLSQRVVRPGIHRARRLALAAIRETFEETGLVIGAPGEGSALPAGTWADFAATGHLPDLSSLTYFARAITPPRRPKRFDTRFFVVDHAAIRHRIADVVTPDSELTELAWLTMAETAELPLPTITRVVLADLDELIRLGGPKPGMAVPFYYEINRKFRRELIDPEAAASSGR
jgi:8-oxo-dGTP pyrophosphatase MutT (NUDIX family)